MTLIEPSADLTNLSRWDRSADVVVLGLGAAGVSAALEAHRTGADVLVVERTSGGGGASATSEGIFYLGGGTALQQACGYDDDPDNMYAFMRASTTTPDDPALRLFCDEAAAHFDWLEAQGVPFERKAFTGKAVAVRTGEGLLTTGNEKVWPFKNEARPVPRGHQAHTTPTQKGGATAMQALLATFEAERVPALYDARAIGLVTDPLGRVVGVRVKQMGTELAIEARKGVILATGSFNLNTEMTMANFPLMATHGKPLGIETNDGAGVLLGESVGAGTRGMDGFIATGSIYPPAELVKGIVVNRAGRRFVPEDAYHGRLAHFIEQQPGHTAFLILDEEIFAYPEKGSHRLVDAWETVEEMERALEVPPGALAATLAGYNAGAPTGDDPEFHKAAEWVKPLHPPYAAFDISITSSDYHYIALGGLTANANGQALRSDGSLVEGLYAVGACAAHFPQNGSEYASGMSLGPGSFFGRRAGRHAATGGSDMPLP